MADVIYQTISDFMQHPFRPGAIGDDPKLAAKKKELNQKYESSKKNINFVASCEYMDSYLLHFKIPSDSHQGQSYDVVVQLFPPDKVGAKMGDSLTGYYVQFFSNSPGFIYRYAALYKLHGFMIDVLQEKMDPDYKNKLPDKANKSHEMAYEKSIYFACRYILDNQLVFLSKRRLGNMRRVTLRTLISSIETTKGVLSRDYSEIESGMRKEIKKDTDAARRQDSRTEKKAKSFSTAKPPTETQAQRMVRSAGKIVHKATGKKPKIGAKLSTVRKK